MRTEASAKRKGRLLWWRAGPSAKLRLRGFYHEYRNDGKGTGRASRNDSLPGGGAGPTSWTAQPDCWPFGRSNSNWENGKPEAANNNLLSVLIETDSLGGWPIGEDTEGLPVALMSDFPDESDSEDPDLTSSAWVLMGLVTGKACTVLHRLSDAEYIGRQALRSAPQLWQLSDPNEIKNTVPKGVGCWVTLTTHLLNHAVPRAPHRPLKEYLSMHR